LACTSSSFSCHNLAVADVRSRSAAVAGNQSHSRHHHHFSSHEIIALKFRAIKNGWPGEKRTTHWVVEDLPVQDSHRIRLHNNHRIVARGHAPKYPALGILLYPETSSLHLKLSAARFLRQTAAHIGNGLEKLLTF
jgi:hypothetical protein